jgi:hypothetical protein
MFVSHDGFAYVAFSQRERTLETKSCTPGTVIDPRDVTVALHDQVVLWQIHADGSYRSTTVEDESGRHRLSELLALVAPTGAIIPDGPDGVLLAIRETGEVRKANIRPSQRDFIYRLDRDGKVVYKYPIPAYEGPLHDEMVLGEQGQGFATRGGVLIAFNVQEGKELWRWDSKGEELEVVAALADGSCLVQSPTAVFKVDNAATFHEVMKGQIMIDWQGKMYRKHD